MLSSMLSELIYVLCHYFETNTKLTICSTHYFSLSKKIQLGKFDLKKLDFQIINNTKFKFNYVFDTSQSNKYRILLDCISQFDDIKIILVGIKKLIKRLRK